MLVDTCAMELIRAPEQFDVIVTTNLFGDILSDEASMLVGGLGVACSGNIGERAAVFEPVHGSAPAWLGTAPPTRLATFYRRPCCSITWASANRPGECALGSRSCSCQPGHARSGRNLIDRSSYSGFDRRSDHDPCWFFIFPHPSRRKAAAR
jgi:hypothetical protein